LRDYAQFSGDRAAPVIVRAALERRRGSSASRSNSLRLSLHIDDFILFSDERGSRRLSPRERHPCRRGALNQQEIMHEQLQSDRRR
jgi:hypothetical protein